MKIAVSATGDNLDSQIDPRFGRCRYFLIVDQDTMDFEAMPNESATAPGGAGIRAAQTIANKGINALITGDIGPNAFQTLSAAGIKTITGARGAVREVLEQYKKGNLKATMSATAAAHTGMGRGRNMGRGVVQGTRAVPDQTAIIKEQEISALEEELEQAKQQIAQIKKRLEDLNK